MVEGFTVLVLMMVVAGLLVVVVVVVVAVVVEGFVGEAVVGIVSSYGIVV